MSYKQVVKPDMSTVDGLGWCLRFSQSVFRAPVAYPSARAAWDGQRGRHTGQPPKGIAVPVWFDHWGTYQGRWANWGHVAISLGDGRFFTSPLLYSHLNGRGVGSAYYPNMAAMQAHIGGNPKYLGWSESMNGKQVVDTIPAPVKPTWQEEDDEMSDIYIQDAATKGQGSIYRLMANGRKRLIPSAEWRGIRARESAAAQAGVPQPVIVGQMSAADLKKIPNA